MENSKENFYFDIETERLFLTMCSFKVLHGGTNSCLQLNDAHAIIKSLEQQNNKDRSYLISCKKSSEKLFAEGGKSGESKESPWAMEKQIIIIKIQCVH